jgi:hypothetical protein
MKKVLGSMVTTVVLLSMVACSVDQILTDLDLVIQTASVICESIGAVSPADSMACAALAGVATTGVNLIKSDYDAWKKSGAQTDLQKLQAAMTTFQANLPQELAAAHIESPVAQQKVTAWANLVVTTVNAVASLLPQLQTGDSAKAQRTSMQARATASNLLLPETIRTRWVAEVCQGDQTCAKRVHIRKKRTW